MPSVRERRSWGFVAGLCGLAVAGPFLGCGPGAEPEGNELVDGLLERVGPDVVLPTLAEVEPAFVALAQATGAWVADPGSADAREAAQAAWREAMAAWQVAEVHQLGPAATSLRPGGRDLRDAIYSWPTTSRCRVDQATADGPPADVAAVRAQLVDVRGLDALEVLLFSPPTENGCLPSVAPNASGAWDALGADGIAAARAAHAAVLAEDLVGQVRLLQTAWDPDGEDFGALLGRPGVGDSPYDGEADALDAVYAALFYLELVTKDQKLGEVLGLQPCEEGCSGAPETALSGSSHLWIGPNLEGFRRLFHGGEGRGLDDLLDDLGHGDLAVDLEAALDAADLAASALVAPIEESGMEPGDPGRAAYEAVKVLTDLLKGDLVTVLALAVPQEAAGDND
ncbi:MAG: hypothetical protein H6732_11795 [Alphaproteobacteria bacterium]|nr:hypothetical protein [Alphaproteobacteria bacterium]